MGAWLGGGRVGPSPNGAGPLGAGPSGVRQVRLTPVCSKKFLWHPGVECGKNKRSTRSGALVRCNLAVFYPPLQTSFLDSLFLDAFFFLFKDLKKKLRPFPMA